METFNCFFLGDDGKISDVIFLDCEDEGAALKRADALLRSNPAYRHVELWQADRLIYGNAGPGSVPSRPSPAHAALPQVPGAGGRT
jgi:hypothetical protein